MKKTYIVPNVEVSRLETVQMMTASIIKVEGVDDLDIGTGDVPGTANSKGWRSDESF